MSKPVKEMIVRDLTAHYAGTDSAVWVELIGVDGINTNNFRRELRARHMRLEVVKTSLFKRAFASGPLAKLAKELGGPAALVTGGSSAVEVAKLLEEWLPKIGKNLRIRGAVLEGEFLDETRVKDLARMPTKADLQGRIVSIVLAPGGNIIAAALSGGTNIAGCLKALIEKLEKAAPAAEPMAEAATAPAAESAAAPA